MQKLKNFSSNEDDFISAVIRLLPERLSHLGHNWPTDGKKHSLNSAALVSCLDCWLIAIIDYESAAVIGPATHIACPFPEPTNEAHLYSEYDEVGFMEKILFTTDD
jgi:hypothetical protein